MITPPVPNQDITESDKMRTEFMLWTQAVTNLQPIIGVGSPEGNVEALQFREYIDSTGAAGNIKWCKMLTDIAGDKKKGWLKI